MKKLTHDELKQYYLEMLNYFADFCDQHNLVYYLYAGSLLGAVRHKGFIPWDDDIDVAMPRPDYCTLLNLSKEFLCRYSIEYFNTNKYYLYPYAKVRDKETVKICKDRNFRNTETDALEIDIFPIDGYLDDIKKAERDFKKQKKAFHRYLTLLNDARRKKPDNFKHMLIRIESKFYNVTDSAKKVSELAQKNHYEKCNYVGNSVSIYRGKMERAPKKCYEERIKLLFEGKEYWCPKGYDEILKSIFGDDYMTPPPVEKRVSTHEGEIYKL